MAGLGRAALPLCMSALLIAGCDENGRTGDGGIEMSTTPGCPHGYDKSVDISTAQALPSAQEATGTVCPLKDSDFYKVEHKGSLLKVELTGSLEDSGTPIQLVYLILDKDGKVVGTAPSWISGIRHFQDYHCLQSGTYYVQVKDDGDDAKDGNNLYHLKVTSALDKDTNEPTNNTQTGAKAPGTGYISCKGDLDWFTFTVGAGQAAQVQLKTDKATSLALKYSIYDGKTRIAEEGGTASGSQPLNLDIIHCLPKAGTYTLLVEDSGGNRSDPDAAYTLSVTPKNDTDSNEGVGRNDTPATATDCGAGCTKTGQINCKGDYDYYRVDVSGVSATNPGVIEIEVDFGGKSKIEPQVALIYADEPTPCTKDSCCRVLSGTCNNNDLPPDENGCGRRTYNCVKKDDIFCADADCKPPSNCATQQACAGAVVCLPNKLCGGEQFSRNDDNGEDATGARVITAQPLLHPGPFYVRVGDLKNDEWEYGRSYTVRIAARVDPDGSTKELNSEYFPNQVPTNVNTYEWHKKNARPSYTLGVGGSITIDGTISYQGDWDWYVIKPPGAACGVRNECTLTVSFSTSGDCSNVQPVYMLHKSGGDPWFSFPKNGQPLSGNPGCVYVNSAGTYYFSVSDYQHNGWSWSCQYHATIATAAGCNSPCVVQSGTSGSGCTVP